MQGLKQCLVKKERVRKWWYKVVFYAINLGIM
jgi:hypothetical protein